MPRDMIRTEKAKHVRAILQKLYPEVDIPLEHEDPFTLLVAVILSAQCTDANVNKVTPELFRRAGTAAKMARLTPREIERIIRACGLAPTKSRHIHALSRILLDRFDGQVPRSFEALESLPGVGHKTASVVMGQAFGIPAFPVDTHIHRLAYRWGLADGTTVEDTEAALKQLFPRDQWNRIHLQLIHYGREYCPARGHNLARCVICRQLGVRARLARAR